MCMQVFSKEFINNIDSLHHSRYRHEQSIIHFNGYALPVVVLSSMYLMPVVLQIIHSYFLQFFAKANQTSNCLLHFPEIIIT